MGKFLIKIALVASLAFIFSCSSGDGGGGDNFKTVKIGNQVWMAENYEVNGSSGLYDWVTAMALPSECNNKDCTSQISEMHQGMCPSGWHIPNSRDWYTLGVNCDSEWKNGASCGFGGLHSEVWWSSYVDNGSIFGHGFFYDLIKDVWNFKEQSYDKSSLLSVRCIKDNNDFESNLVLVESKTINLMPFVIAYGGGSLGDQGDKTVPSGAGGSVGSYNGERKFPNITAVWEPTANGGNGGMVSINSISGAGVGNNDIHGFGTAGKQIPPQRAGELILTVYPSTKNSDYYDWLRDETKQRFFGLPPQMVGDPNNPEAGEWWGLVDPSKETEYFGGFQFVKNGFPNESNTKGNIKIAPTRCTTQFYGEPRMNCLNFNLKAQQPFQLAVTVYDQQGNFITQYKETLTEQEFRNIVQAPNYVSGTVNTSGASSGCELPTPNNYGAPTTLTTNGIINVGVNIYPIYSDGRRWGNGVYVAKIDRIDLPFKDGERNPYTGNGYTCVSAGGGNSVRISPSYMHYHADLKFILTNQ